MTDQHIRDFHLPDVGEGLTEAEILRWYVTPGDTVHDGMVVCEVETAKAAVELPVPFDGTVHALHVAEGTTADIGAVIISIATAAPAATPSAAPSDPALPAAAPAPERIPVLVGYGAADSAPSRRRTNASAHPSAPANGMAPALASVPVPVLASAGTTGRPLAKPPVRKLAKDLGVDLAALHPSRDDGVITREEVVAAASVPAPRRPQGDQVRPAPTPAATAPQPLPPVCLPPAPDPGPSRSQHETRTPIKGVRRATAQAMVASAFTAPHVTEFLTVDVTRTMRLVRQLKQDPDLDGVRVGPLLLVARALLLAVRRNPDVNAFWDEAAQEIVVKQYVNLGIAAATPRGLLVPNIKDAGALSLRELAAGIGDLVQHARSGRTTPQELTGGTITITNIGALGVDTGTPILNPGEAAILGFGAVNERPWVHKGRIVPRQVTTLALSFDHRLVDGELGSRVLTDTAALLEQPKRFLTWG